MPSAVGQFVSRPKVVKLLSGLKTPVFGVNFSRGRAHSGFFNGGRGRQIFGRCRSCGQRIFRAVAPSGSWAACQGCGPGFCFALLSCQRCGPATETRQCGALCRGST